jgi:TPR repeat protein
MSHSKQTARRPVSYAGASSTEPCEGWQASPSNPNHGRKHPKKEPLSDTFVFRCTYAEKAELRDKAALAGVSVAQLLREAMGNVNPRRRKAPPRVDPALVLAIGRVGGNLNQIARWLNRAAKAGHVADIDALKVAAQLIVIERQLAQISKAAKC